VLDRLIHSLSAKLLLLFICAGAVLLLLVGAIVGKGFAGHFRTSIRPFMVHYVELMEQELGSPPDYERARQITKGIPVDVHVFGPSQNWSTSSQLPDQAQLEALMKTSDVKRGLTRMDSIQQDPALKDSNRIDPLRKNPVQLDHLRQYKLRSLADDMILFTHSGGFDIYFQIHQPSELRHGGQYGMTILLSIFAIMLLMYYATKALFRPIEDIQRGVTLIGRGNLKHRIVKRRNDQLGDLADNVNAMADDISDMLEAKRQLLLGISHELRSPITRSRVNLALMEDSASKREVEKDMASMEEMITELLESERLSNRHASLNLEKIRLDHLIRELVQHEFRRKVKVMELVKLEANLDQARIKLLLRNLLQNAIKHSVDPNRQPTISLINEVDEFCIYVTDSGEGIKASHIPHLTQPFYRADPSRQRKTGGYGLGLHLCRVIVEAHGGKLDITSEMGIGTKIRCGFPAQI
jgi:signal transduction histidine kinase